MELVIKNAQIIEYSPGKVAVTDRLGKMFAEFHGEFAKKIKEQYENSLKQGAGDFNVSLRLDINVEEPIGKMMP